MGIKWFKALQVKFFLPGVNVYFSFCIKIQYFSIFMQNFQYLHINPQYLCKIFNICTFAFCSLLSLVCVQVRFILTSGVRERGIIVPVLSYLCTKSSILRICSYIGFFFSLISLIRVQVDLYLTSGVRERGYHHLYLHLSYLCVFSYFCTLFKSLIN